MRTLTLTAIAALISAPSFANSALPISIEVKYGQAQPFLGIDDYNEKSFSISYDGSANGQGQYFAADMNISQDNYENYGLIAAHYGQAWEKTHFGAVGGMSFGETNGKFLGLEWGYTGERLEVDIRGTHWRLDGVPSNTNRIDIRADYDIWRGIGVYYDYTHQFATKDGFKVDEFLGGLTYDITPNQTIELGMGNVHPQDTLTGENRVWTQYALSYKISLGNKGRIDPVDLPNFYDY